jgi:hypothetical protein
MKIRPKGDGLSHVDGQTDVTKITAAFRNFVKAPKNASYATLFMNDFLHCRICLKKIDCGQFQLRYMSKF